MGGQKIPEKYNYYHVALNVVGTYIVEDDTGDLGHAWDKALTEGDFGDLEDIERHFETTILVGGTHRICVRISGRYDIVEKAPSKEKALEWAWEDCCIGVLQEAYYNLISVNLWSAPAETAA